MNNKLIDLLVTFGGVGRAPKASGTAGSLAALPFAYFIHLHLGSYALLAASIIVFAVGVWASECYVKATLREDPKEIVIDEVAGQWLLLAFLYPTFHSYVVGFFLFRLFDVLKPWPISLADRKVGGGFGVMLDDILAAIYPLVLLVVAVVVSALMGWSIDWNGGIQWLGGAYVQ